MGRAAVVACSSMWHPTFGAELMKLPTTFDEQWVLKVANIVTLLAMVTSHLAEFKHFDLPALFASGDGEWMGLR